MKIAIFQEDFTIGGVQKSLLNLLNSLDYKRVSVDLYLTDDLVFYKEKLNPNVKIKYLKKMPKILKYCPLNIVRFFYKVEIEDEYDIAIDFSTYRYETAIGVISTKAKKKYIMCHDAVMARRKYEFRYWVFTTLHKPIYKYFDDVIAVSSNSLKEVNTYLGRSLDKGIVLPNIIRTDIIAEFSKNKIAFETDPKYLNIVTMGRFCVAKGYDLMINMISKLPRNDIRLYIIGGGEDFVKIKNHIQKLNLEDKIILLGKIANPYPYIKKMDYYLSMSRYEGQGMAILEAANLGLPCIISKHLEKSQNIVKGTDDILEFLTNAKRIPKHKVSLKKYNQDILNTFYKLGEDNA